MAGEFSVSSKAVVFPAGSVAGYGLIYSLGLAGVHVVATNPAPCDNFHSRYVSEHHVVPDPLVDHEAFVAWLEDYGKRQSSKPVLFMAEDLYAYIVSLYQDELSKVCLYPYLPLDKLDRFFNKKVMFEYAEKAGLALPRTLTEPSQEALAAWDTFPAVIKPLVSRFTFEGRRLVDAVKLPKLFGSKAIRVENRDELLETARRVEAEGIRFFVQELLIVPNRELVTVKFVTGRDQSLPSVFIGRKVRQHPADFGTCTVGESDYIQELHEASERFIRTIEFHGGGGIEYLWCNRDKAWYFIELNPRLDFWISMATLKGVNLALQQYLLCTDQPLFVQRQSNGGRFWIDLPGDLRDWKSRRIYPEWKVSLRERLKPYLYFNEAVFNWRDPIPGAMRLLRTSSLWTGMKWVRSALRKKGSAFVPRDKRRRQEDKP